MPKQTADEHWPELPERLRPMFEDLWQSVVFVHAKWALYQDLFGRPDTIALLRDSAPTAALLIERSLRAALVMAISRLTDGIKSSGHETLSLERFAYLMRSHDAGLAESMWAQIDELRISAEPIRRLRNKSIGHNDLKTALKYEAEPLPNVPRQLMDEVLQRIAATMNTAQMHFQGGPTDYGSLALDGDGKQLVAILQRARDGREATRREPRANGPPL